MIIIPTGYQAKHGGISNELCTRIMGRVLVGICIHDNSRVSYIMFASHNDGQSTSQSLTTCKSVRQ